MLVGSVDGCLVRSRGFMVNLDRSFKARKIVAGRPESRMII